MFRFSDSDGCRGAESRGHDVSVASFWLKATLPPLAMPGRSHHIVMGADGMLLMLAGFHRDVLNMLTQSLGESVPTMHEALAIVCNRRMLDKRLIGKIRRLDAAHSVARHLADSYLADVRHETSLRHRKRHRKPHERHGQRNG